MMLIKQLLIFFFLLLHSFSSAQENKYHIIDSIASLPQESAIKSTKKLALDLTKNYIDSLEKVRAIYVYLMTHITYDYTSYYSKTYINSEIDNKNRKLKNENNFVHSILVRKQGICQDFAEVLSEMCKHSGIRSGIIIGFAKGEGWINSDINKQTNHAWNYVVLNNDTLLYDATWASCLNEKEFFFCSDPKKLVYTHLPVDSKFQLLKRTISKEEFTLLPKVYPSYFNNNKKGYLEDLKIARMRMKIKK
jgi:transglutaminase/protease-like cytokinesis protein 3